MRALLILLIVVSGCAPGLRGGAEPDEGPRYTVFDAFGTGWGAQYYGTRINPVPQRSGPPVSFDLVLFYPSAGLVVPSSQSEIAVWIRPGAGVAAALELGGALSLNIDGSAEIAAGALEGRLGDMLGASHPLGGSKALRPLARGQHEGKLYLLDRSAVRQLKSASEVRFEVLGGAVEVEGQLRPENLAVVQRFLGEPRVIRFWPTPWRAY